MRNPPDEGVDLVIEVRFRHDALLFDRISSVIYTSITLNLENSSMKVILTIASVAMLTLACNAQPQGSAAVDLKNEQDSASYAIGASIGGNLKQQGAEVNADMLAAGLKDALAGQSKLTDEQMQTVLMAFQERAMKKQQEEMSKKGEANQKKGVDFLAANEKKEGVKKTASGLQYKVIKEGNGKKPSATDQVTVHYTGTLIDGTKFDSSVDRGQPATFGLNQVIPGWTEGLQLMSEGSKYMLYIPSELGYGANGAGGSIGPNEVLVFEVELIKIGG